MRRAALPFLLVISSVALYFMLAAGFGVYQRYPILHFVGCIAGSAWLVVLFSKERSIGRGIVTFAALGLSLAYFWYALSYSSYGSHATQIAEGQVLAELSTIELLNQDGVSRKVLDPEDSRATLIILYRGYW